MLNLSHQHEGFDMATHSTTGTGGSDKARKLLARLRQRQLKLAVDGRVSDSARYAARASRVRQVSRAAVAA